MKSNEMKSFQLHNQKPISANRLTESPSYDIPWKDMNVLINHVNVIHSIQELTIAVMNMLTRSRWFTNIAIMILPSNNQPGKYGQPIFIEHSENETDAQAIRKKALFYFINSCADNQFVCDGFCSMGDYVPDSIDREISSHYAAITVDGKDLGIIYVQMKLTKRKSGLQWIDMIASIIGSRIQAISSGQRTDSIYTFFEHFPNAVFVINKEKHILYKNKEAAALLNNCKRASEAEDLRYIGGHSTQKWINILNQTEKRLYRDDIIIDDKIYRLLAVPGADFKGKLESYIVILQDYSEERDQQRFQFHRSQMSLLGHMASNIAHHCNNPLTTIQGLSEILMNQFYGRPEYNDLNSIHAEAGKLINIIRKLIQFSRYTGNPESCDLNKLILLTLLFFDENLEKRSIVCHMKLTEIPAIHLFAVDELSLILYHIFNFCINCYDERSEKANVHIITDLVNSIVHFDVICENAATVNRDMKKLFIPFTGDTHQAGLENLNLAMTANLLHARHSEIGCFENVCNGFTLSCKFPTFKFKQTDSYLMRGII